MKVFYLFNIKEPLKELYINKKYELYKIFKKIYYMPEEEVNYVKTLLDQLINDNDKELIDRDLFVKLHRDYQYSKRGNIHYLNDFYKDEVSRLIVKRRFIRLEVDTDDSDFFKIISMYSGNYFACEFRTNRFFFLKDKVYS